MSSVHRIDVVVPARNEEHLIGDCLRSVIRSAEFMRGRAACFDVEFGITVVADDCSDSTASVASQFPDVRIEVVDFACVGAARERGVSSAVERSSLAVEERWVANTDADSIVPPNWLLHQLDVARGGFDLMIGTVRPNDADLSEAQWEVWRETHADGQANGHVHGANLGFRLSRYLECGGYRPVAEHEDNDLVARLLSNGARAAASDDAEVVTSGRRLGRTPGGYAGYLRLLDESASQNERVLRVDVDD